MNGDKIKGYLYWDLYGDIVGYITLILKSFCWTHRACRASGREVKLNASWIILEPSIGQTWSNSLIPNMIYMDHGCILILILTNWPISRVQWYPMFECFWHIPISCFCHHGSKRMLTEVHADKNFWLVNGKGLHLKATSLCWISGISGISGIRALHMSQNWKPPGKTTVEMLGDVGGIPRGDCQLPSEWSFSDLRRRFIVQWRDCFLHAVSPAIPCKSVEFTQRDIQECSTLR